MKRNFWAVVLVCAAVGLTALDADARRMGGGKSIGRQSSNVTQREATPPTAPTNAGATQNATGSSAARPGTPAAAAAPKRPWAGILGGIAAGLGLAWLANALGLGAGFANMLLILLVALAGFAAWRYFSARSRQTQAGNGGLAFQGAGAGRMPKQYSPNNVGNDASARPFERSPQLTQFDGSAAAGGGTGGAHSALGGAGVSIGSALSGAQGWGVPAGFDTEGFLKAAKRNFVTLQDAWDRSDISALRTMMTDGMVSELQAQLAEREAASGGQPNKTEVVMLDAQLLGIEELPDAYLASVEFSGMIREDDSAGPSPFREVWNMSKPLNGGGWLVAGVQALQ
ncbi:TIM44-like domain-containing protein [Xenophilus arseniciresistens]|uniref:TIM44-like domain-containing protein n=1 Tax=Xenophilus arseniciresistens TaxID=1283306 RepID=A0AAE3NAF7_9BURK|nr:TIM44-like domain-containing protein [Xenophilus arseniciresistens]MDA7416697.1 TIM44-like domain-containing protein [Xenophilus arseniciresistens]